MGRLQRAGWFMGDVKDKVMGGTKSDRDFAKMGKEAHKSTLEKKKIYFRVLIYKPNDNPFTFPMLILCYNNSEKLVDYRTLTGNEVAFIKNAIKSKLNDLESVKGYIRGTDIGSEMIVLKSFQKAPSRDVEQLFNSKNYYDLDMFMRL